jgi:hypothetical protein
LHNDELEDFLRQQTDDHRMYPSDKLWRNIQLTLHGETRWPALTYISIFIIASLVISTLLMKPEERMKKNVAVYTAAVTASNVETALANRSEAAENSPVQHAYTDKITQNTIEAVNDKVSKEQHSVINTLSVAHYVSKNNAALIQTKVAINPASIAAAVVKAPLLSIPATAKNSKEELATVSNASKPASMYFSTLGLMDLSGLKTGGLVQHSLANIDNEEIWRSFPLLNANDIILKKLSKFNFQFYITPSISYRQLTDAKGKAARSYTAIPLSSNYKIDINNIVKHTPSVGAEVGFALGYQLNNRFTVKSGLQFNVRQYNITAYPAVWPSTPVNIPEGSNETTDALATSAPYTQADSRPIVLRNRYYEIAAPIGMDYKVFAGPNGTVTINVAATVQPTYTFDKEPFVITTDYKNYADGSLLMRNWNINSSVEAYIGYKLGAFRWQIGPQFRYQHLPTYGGGYPIREHLLDYGIKLGFTKSLN